MRFFWIIAWALLAVLVDVSLARLAFGAVVPSLRADLRLDLTAIGVISAANAVGYLVTSALTPAIGRIAGMRQIAIVAHIVAALGFAGAAVSPTAGLLIAARVVSGLGGGIGIVAALRLALDAVAPKRRVLVSTLAWSGGGLGLVLAALAQPWLHVALSWRIAAAVCAALALLIAITAPAHTTAAASASATPAARWRWQGSALVLTAYTLFGAGFLAYSTFAGIAPSHTTPFVRFLSIGVAAIAGSVLAARVRHPERGMAIAFAVGATGALLTIAGSPLGDIFFGLGLTSIPGLATAVLRDRAGSAAATQAIALSTIAVGGGQFVGPLLAGAAAQHFGLAWAPGIAGVSYAIAIVFIALDEWTRVRARYLALLSAP